MSDHQDPSLGHDGTGPETDTSAPSAPPPSRQANASGDGRVGSDSTANNGKKGHQCSRKAASAYRTISEVSKELDLPAHVLRFWETKFTQVKPLKRGGNRRYYRPDDVDVLRTIKALLYTDGLTIKGVQKLFREKGLRATVQDRLAPDAGLADAMEAAGSPPDNHGPESTAPGDDGHATTDGMPAPSSRADSAQATQPAQAGTAGQATLRSLLNELRSIRTLLDS